MEKTFSSVEGALLKDAATGVCVCVCCIVAYVYERLSDAIDIGLTVEPINT